MVSVKSCKEGGDCVRMTVSGRFDFQLHREFRKAYEDLKPTTKIIVDLQETVSLDSAAMGMLMAMRAHIGEDKAEIELRNCNPIVTKTIDIFKMQRFFKVSTD